MLVRNNQLFGLLMENYCLVYTTFNNISVISMQWVFLVEETEVHRENQQTVASHWQTLSHNVVSSYRLEVNYFQMLRQNDEK
jgi:hypothetical protein